VRPMHKSISQFPDADKLLRSAFAHASHSA
jgi:hypothetical protein